MSRVDSAKVRNREYVLLDAILGNNRLIGPIDHRAVWKEAESTSALQTAISGDIACLGGGLQQILQGAFI